MKLFNSKNSQQFKIEKEKELREKSISFALQLNQPQSTDRMIKSADEIYNYIINGYKPTNDLTVS